MLSVTTPTVNPSALNSNSIDPSVAFTVDNTEKKKKKKKKRSRDDDQADAAETPATELGERKKKRKRTDAEQSVEETATHELNLPTQVNTSPDDSGSSKPKKKKKDKGKAKDSKLTEQTDAQIEADSQASAAALLSAIVAASVTNHEAPQTAHPPQYNPHMPPHNHPFMPYPPMQYGYPPGPFDPHGGQPPNVFAPPGAPGGSTAFSELAFGSNEDLLRALQDLDMSKIANVLKTLGDAASNNGPSFAPQLGFMPSQLNQLAPPPSVRPVPAASNSILGVPSQTMPSTGHRRTINMNLSGNEQHSNPDHAHLLANKWLNASKLAELVRDEGITLKKNINRTLLNRCAVLGLVYKKGKFSAIEEEQLRIAIERYRQVCTAQFEE